MFLINKEGQHPFGHAVYTSSTQVTNKPIKYSAVSPHLY